MRREPAPGMRSLIAATAAAAVATLLRRCYLYWGATDEEMAIALPGDELLRRADLTATPGNHDSRHG
jgi:hypothetical protein